MDLNTLQNVRQLSQLRPANTTAQSILSVPQKQKVSITSITVCNQSNAASTYSIFVDKNGTTWDETTAIACNVAISANTATSLEWRYGMPLDPTAAGSVGVRSGNANALTFTICGAQIS